jgi:hypothetical protein
MIANAIFTVMCVSYKLVAGGGRVVKISDGRC